MFYQFSVAEIVEKLLFELSPVLRNYYTLLSYDQTFPRFGLQDIEGVHKPSSIQKIVSSIPFFSRYFKDLDLYCVYWIMFITELRVKYYQL